METRPETLPQDADALEKRRHEHTLLGLADVDSGRLIDDDAMRFWAESLDTDQERPVPQPG